MLLTAWHLAATALAPGLRLLLRRRAKRGKEVASRLAERRGIDDMPRPAGRLLWLHAASVGEVASVLPVLAALRRRDPLLHLLLTTGTVTSMRLLAQRLPEMGLAGVIHRFLPWDVPGWVQRFLRHWHPDAGALIESELWPNLLLACRERGLPLMLVNARLSARSAARWQRLPGTVRQVLGAFRQVRAQSDADAARFRTLGALDVSAPGDLKFAAAPLPVDEAESARLRRLLGDGPIWLAASTHEGEEAMAADVHRRLLPAHPGLVTVIAPRHPERGAVLAAALGAGRRSLAQDPVPGGIWLADTLGELGLLYRLTGLAFVGKSLAGRGGQNPLEAARLGCAVAVGPHTANFRQAVAVLEGAGALTQVADAAALAAWVDGMLAARDRRDRVGQAGVTAAGRYADLPDQTAAALLDLLNQQPAAAGPA